MTARATVVLALMVVATYAAVATAAGPPAFFIALPASGSAELQTPRAFALSAPLPDGQVLIAGGINGATFLQSAELFNPVTDTFTGLPAIGNSELQTPRYSPAAAPLPNGQVLIAGGRNGSTFLQSAELFNPASRTFSALAASGNTELQTPRDLAATAPLPDGDVLIAGGSNGTSVVRSAELFHPATDTFTALPAAGNSQLSVPREEAAAVALPSGKVLIAGGNSGSGNLQSAELFDPATDTFAALAASGTTELQTARATAAAARLPDGKVLIAGGFGATYLQSAEIFNPADNTFTALPASGNTELQTARQSPIASALPDGQVLFAGGYNAGSLPSAELYFSAPEAALAGGAFGAQNVGAASRTMAVVVTNVGAQGLSVTSTSLTGAGASQFAITADGCSGETLAFDKSCKIAARFTPAATGAQTAAIALADNEPTVSTIALTGTGQPPAGGPAGPTGPTGVAGAPGAAGQKGTDGANASNGTNGRDLVVTCTVRKQRVKGKTVTRKKCTTKLTASRARHRARRARAHHSRARHIRATRRLP